MAGLRFEDIQAQLKHYDFPHLEKFIEQSALANNIVRSIASSTCRADGWLSLNTGQRMADVYRGGAGICADFKALYDSGRVHDWNAYKFSEENSNYNAKLGTLAEGLKGVKTQAIGYGAAVALADANGKPDSFLNAHDNSHVLGKNIVQSLKTNQLVMVDVGQVRPYQFANVRAYSIDSYVMSKERGRIDRRQYTQEKMLKRGGQDYLDTRLAYKTRELMERLDTVLSYQDEGQNIMLVSLADSGPIPHLQVAAFKGDVFEGKGFVDSTSTRHVGLIQNTDIHSEILNLFGKVQASPLSTVDSALPTVRVEDLRPDSVQNYEGSRFNVLIDRSVHADRIKRTAPVFLTYMVSVTALLFLSIGLLLNKRFVRFLNRVSGWNVDLWVSNLRVLRVFRFVAVTVSCIPICGMLYNLFPWWQYPMQQVGTVFVSTFMAATVALVCSLGRVGSSFVLPFVIVCLLHVVAFTVDPFIGNQLLLDSVLGSQTLVGARMYGFGNIMFALYSSAMLMLAAVLCEPFVGRGKRHNLFIVFVLSLFMVVSVLVDGLPKLGADFGGPPAIIPAFIFLILLILGVKVNVKRVVLIFTFTVLVVSAIAVFDWFRPVSERTHLGNFVEIVLNGGLWTVVYRKLGANINMLSSPLIVIAIGGVVLIAYILVYPYMNRNTSKNIDTYSWVVGDSSVAFVENFKVFKPMLYSLAVMHFIGGALNDSGIIIPGNAIILVVPMCLATWLTWMVNVRMQNPSRVCKIVI